MTEILQENLIALFSENRLKSYNFNCDDNAIVLERYLYNIEVSKALYPLLSILEISLRNRINKAIERVIQADWLLKELQYQNILLDNEYKKLLDDGIINQDDYDKMKGQLLT